MKNSEEEIQKFLEQIADGKSNRELLWAAIQIKIVVALTRAKCKIKKFLT